MTTRVSLSREDLEVLRNVASINNSLKFSADNQIKTMSPDQSILMEAEISSSFPQEFSIYELNKFLGVVTLPTMKDATLVFQDDKKVTIDGGTSRVHYYFTNQSFTEHPNKNITLPSVELKTFVTGEILDGFQKVASALGHKILAFRVLGGKATLVATNPEIDTSNDYVVDLGDALQGDGSPSADAEFKLKIDNLKILPGDYTFEICARGLMKLTHNTRKIVFFLGLEKE